MTHSAVSNAVRAAFVFAAALATFAWAGTQAVTLVNRTGVTIVSVYLSPCQVDEWEDDVLGVEVLGTRESVPIEFSPKEKATCWDLKVVDEDGDSAVWYALRLDKISKVTLRYDKDGNPLADTE